MIRLTQSRNSIIIIDILLNNRKGKENKKKLRLSNNIHILHYEICMRHMLRPQRRDDPFFRYKIKLLVILTML